jgi:hypothetical protein
MTRGGTGRGMTRGGTGRGMTRGDGPLRRSGGGAA